MRFESWSKTDIGLVRESNQDYVGCFPSLGLYVVADGMGGHADGEVASRVAVETLERTYAREDDARPGGGPPPGKPETWLARLRRLLSAERAPAVDGTGVDPTKRELARLESAIQEANREIYALGHERDDAMRPMGTTVIALVVRPEARDAVWAHVGDSRLYRLRGDELELLTADHTRFGEPYRGGGKVPLDLPHTNQLISALGVEPTVAVALGSAPLEPGDVFLLASDGVTALVPPDAIRSLLRDMRAPEEAGEELLRRALAAGGSDNASVVIVRALAS